MCNIAVRIESYTKLWNKNICKDWPLKQIKKNNVILDQMMGKKHFVHIKSKNDYGSYFIKS